MNFSKVKAYLDRLPELGIPFCDVAVTYHGKPVLRHAAGFTDPAGTRRPAESDIHYVFSISKITTCVVAMRLVEAGILDLNAPIRHYLPAFANLQVRLPDGRLQPVQTEPTILHLFTMTAGLNYDLTAKHLLQAAEQPDAGTVEIASALASAPLDFEPGTRFAYSLCHDVLAAVVEDATGERFADHVKRVVFDPLGMKDTGYHVPDKKRARIPSMYDHINGPMLAREVPATNQKFIFNDNYDSGGAGLYSTVNDQIRLMTVLANGGKTEEGYSLLNPETIYSLGINRLSPQAYATFEPTRLYGYGWGLCCRTHVNLLASTGRSSVGEFGWDGAAGAYALVDPTKQVAIYFGTQLTHGHYLYRMVHPTLRDLVFEALEDADLRG